jgi:plastocyanin
MVPAAMAFAVLAGCGAGTGSTAPVAGCVPASEVAADGEAPGSLTSVAIVARDDRFDPPCVELGARGPTRFVVRNEGAHPHNLTIGDRRVAVDAGQVGILDVEVTADEVAFVCTLHEGMIGELRVGP